MQFPLVSACKVKNTAGRAGNRCFRTPRTTDFKAEYKKVIRLVFPSEFPKLYSAFLIFSFFFESGLASSISFNNWTTFQGNLTTLFFLSKFPQLICQGSARLVKLIKIIIFLE
jgi:hypothetical protein